MANTTVNNWGFYVPTTYIFKAQQLQQTDIESPEFKNLLVSLYQDINTMCIALNASEKGYYMLTEFNTQKLLFNPTNDLNRLRPVFSTTVNFGALPAVGSKSVAHGIMDIGATYVGFSVSGCATQPSPWEIIPIPYVSATTMLDNLEIAVDATNVTITTGGTDYSTFTNTVVVIEYVKTNS
jgi:hypothetical protein